MTSKHIWLALAGAGMIAGTPALAQHGNGHAGLGASLGGNLGRGESGASLGARLGVGANGDDRARVGVHELERENEHRMLRGVSRSARFGEAGEDEVRVRNGVRIREEASERSERRRHAVPEGMAHAYARARSQGALHANARALARSNAHSALHARTTVSTRHRRTHD